MCRFACFISMIIMCILSSCYTRQEACLDTLATNYDVTADDNCDACCTFPGLILLIKHMAGDSTFSTQKIYTNDLGQNYQLLDIRFYVSSFDLYQSDPMNSTSQIITSISNADNSVSVPDDMKIIRIADNMITLGSVKTYGKMDSLTFDVGLNTTISDHVFVDLPTTHVLLNNNKLKNSDNNLSFATVRYVKIQPGRDTIDLYLSDPGLLTKITLDSIVNTAKGENIRYNLQTDYLKLLKNVNLDSSITTIEKAVNRNFGGIIVVK
jgi:hypothetical protein